MNVHAFGFQKDHEYEYHIAVVKGVENAKSTAMYNDRHKSSSFQSVARFETSSQTHTCQIAIFFLHVELLAN